MQSTDSVIRQLGLEPHPEGGWYRQTFADLRSDGERAHSTAIYYLLQAGEISRWHRIDAVEIWHFYAGSPLELRLSHDGQGTENVLLGAEIHRNERPQAIVPRNVWQSARSTGAFSLLGCTVAPGFEFAGFELAPDGWEPRGPSGR